MPVWAAARCTSAALPYFRAFQWEGHTLLDGAFRWNCPVVVASSEAELIWPNKHRDILLSMGTGMSTLPDSPSTNMFQVFKNVVVAATSSKKIWDKFQEDQEAEGETLADKGIYRLNPSWGEVDFALDDYERLDEIEKLTERWLATAQTQAQITSICDQLIASLFFFTVTPSIRGGTLTGEIHCRLAVDEPSRRSLLERILEAPDLNLFTIEFVDKNRPLVRVNVASLRNVRGGKEFRIPVGLKDIPDVGKIEVQITMYGITDAKSIGTDKTRRYPISGSPYILREETPSDRADFLAIGFLNAKE